MALPSEAEFAILLATAHAGRRPLTAWPPALEPVSTQLAYAVQRRLLQRRRERIAGWKVGAPTFDGPIHAAPLPLSGMRSSLTVLTDYASFVPGGVELEIMFSFGRDFLPGADYADQEVLDSLDRFGAAIEVVASRLAAWPDVTPLVQLADLQNHGALVTGEMVPYRADFPFLGVDCQLGCNGKAMFHGRGGNNAGDPRRLLGWLVRHCTGQGYTLPAGTPVTTGSYTGIFFPPAGGRIVGDVAGLPAVEFLIA